MTELSQSPRGVAELGLTPRFSPFVQPDTLLTRPVAAIHFTTRQADGVSLQMQENNRALRASGVDVLECSADAAGKNAFVMPELDLTSSRAKELKKRIFTTEKGGDGEEGLLQFMLDQESQSIQLALGELLDEHNPSVLHIRNISSLPINPGATVAVAEFIEAHPEVDFVLQYHDHVGEVRRAEYDTPYDALRSRIFGSLYPTGDNVRHVVINTRDQEMLRETRDIDAEVVYDSFDFDKIPEVSQVDVRAKYGISEHDFLLLHPGRIVPRKRIEDAIDYGADYVEYIKNDLNGDTAVLGGRTYTQESTCVVMLPQSHDMRPEYYAALQKKAADRGVRLLYIGDDVVADTKFNSEAQDGGKIPFYSLYTNDTIDRVIVSSNEEGFGNNLLEAFAFSVLRKQGKLVVAHRYPVLDQDIAPVLPENGIIPLGTNSDYELDPETKTLILPEQVRRAAVEQTIWWDQHPEEEAAKAHDVYAAARRHFDYVNVTGTLAGVLIP